MNVPIFFYQYAIYIFLVGSGFIIGFVDGYWKLIGVAMAVIGWLLLVRL